MASRHKLATQPHYKTSRKTHRFKRGPTGNNPNPKPGGVSLHDDESGLEKKMKIKLEAKVIMDRINKITDDFGEMVTAAGLPDQTPASQTPKPPSPTSRKTILNPPSSLTGSTPSIVKTTLTSAAQFQQFQHSKGHLTTLMIDHAKLGLQQTQVLESIKDWFFMVRSGERDEDDDDLTDFMSLLDVMKETRKAVRNVEDVTVRSNEKLGGLFGEIKKVYEKSVDLRKNDNKSEVEAKRVFEEELKKSEDLMDKLQVEWKEERAHLKSRLQNSEEKIAANIKNVTGEKSHLEILVSELTKKTIELEAMNIKLETKNRIAEQIIREPMFGSSLGGGGGAGDAKEVKKLETQIQLLNIKIRELTTELTKKSERLSFLEEKNADAEQETMMRIQAATKKAQKETRSEFEEQTRKFQEMTALMEELARGREEADAESKQQLDAQAAEHKQMLESLKATQDEELTHYRKELTAKQIELDEMQEQVDEVNGKIKKKKEDEKKGRQARATDMKQAEAQLAAANIQNETLQNEVDELKRQLQDQKEENKSVKNLLVETEKKTEEVIAESKVSGDPRNVSHDKSTDRTAPQSASDVSGPSNPANPANKKHTLKRQNTSSLADVEGEVKEELERLRRELEEALKQVSEIEALNDKAAAQQAAAQRSSNAAALSSTEAANVQQQAETHKQESDEHKLAAAAAHAKLDDMMKTSFKLEDDVAKLERGLHLASTSLKTSEDKILYLLSLCAPVEVFDQAEQLEKRDSLISIALTSKDEGSWKPAEKELYDFVANTPGDLEKYKSMLADSQAETRESENLRQELTVANADLKRKIAELENLLNKSKELNESYVEKLGSKMSDEMLEKTKALNDTMKDQMLKNAESTKKKNKIRRTDTMKKANNVTKGMSAFNDGKGSGDSNEGDSAPPTPEKPKKSKKDRWALLKSISAVSNGSKKNLKKEEEEKKDEASSPLPEAEPSNKKEPVYSEIDDFTAKAKQKAEVDRLAVEEKARADKLAADKLAAEQEKPDTPIPAPEPGTPSGFSKNSLKDDDDVIPVPTEISKTIVKEVPPPPSETPPPPTAEATPIEETLKTSEIEPSPSVKKKPAAFGGGLSLAARMNARRRDKSSKTEEKNDGEEKDNKQEEEKKAELEKQDSHNFQDRLLYFGVKKQKVGMHSAMANIKANTMAKRLLKRSRAKKADSEKALEEQAKKAKEMEEQLAKEKEEAKAKEGKLLQEKEAKLKEEQKLQAKLADESASNEERAKVEEQIKASKEEQEALQKDMEKQASDLKLREAEIEAEKEEIAILQAMVEKDEEKIHALEETNVEKESIIMDLESEIKHDEEMIKEVEDELQTHIRHESELQEQLEKALANTGENNSGEPDNGAIVELQEELKRTQMEKANTEAERKEYEMMMAERAKEAEISQAELLRKVAELESMLVVERERADASNRNHRNDIDRQRNTVVDLQKQLRGLSVDMSATADGTLDENATALQKLTYEHERALNEMAQTMNEKSKLLELKAADYEEAQAMIHDLRVKVVEGEGEIDIAKREITRKAKSLAKSQQEGKKLQAKRELEKNKMREKMTTMKKSLTANGMEKLAETKQGMEKIVEVMKENERLLEDKEAELEMVQKSEKELEELVNQYEDAIDKLTNHVKDKDVEFEVALDEGAKLLALEKERADEIFKQLTLLKEGKIDEEEAEKAVHSHRRTMQMEQKVHKGLQESAIAKQQELEAFEGDMENTITGFEENKRDIVQHKEEAKQLSAVVAVEEKVLKDKHVDAEKAAAKAGVVVKTPQVTQKKSPKGNKRAPSPDITVESEEEEEEEEEEFTVDDLDLDYDEENLRSVAECTARVEMKIDKLDNYVDAKKGRRNDPQSRETRGTLSAIKEDMVMELVQFGVDGCAALRAEIEKQWLKLKMLHQWKSGMMGGGGSGDDGDETSFRVQYEMPAQLAVLKLAIKEGGGWRAALYLSTGDMNINCDLSNWPMTDQVEMYKDIRAHMEDKEQEQLVLIDSVETKLVVEKDRATALEREVKAARKAAKNNMLKSRKEKESNANSLISAEDFNRERKLMAEMHQKTTQMALELLKLSLPDAKSRRNTIMKQLTEAANKPPVLPGLKSPGKKKSESADLVKKMIDRGHQEVNLAKSYSRRMSVKNLNPGDLDKISPHEMKKQIESTDSICETLDRDMYNMDKALFQLKNRKKEEEDKRKEEVGLKEREIEVLVANQIKMNRVVEQMKADYISEDVEDVIAALKRRVVGLNDELAASRRRNELIEQFKEEGDDEGGGEGGKLEVLERMMEETKPLVALQDDLIAQKMAVEERVVKLDGEMKVLKAKNGTERQVKELVGVRKKAAKEKAEVESKLESVRKEHDGNMEILKDLYERVESATTRLFDNTSYKNFLGWAKSSQAKHEVGGGVGAGPKLKTSVVVLGEFGEGVRKKPDSWDKTVVKELDREMMKIGASVRVLGESGGPPVVGKIYNGEGRPGTSPVPGRTVKEDFDNYNKKFSNTSGSRVGVRKDASLQGWGGMEDIDVRGRMDRNSLEAKMATYVKSPDEKSNFFPVLGKNQGVKRPMTGVDGSQSRLGIARDILAGQR
ncbi:hypothetical protein TL16_g01213 [Triparma laevis f. inornata]|uniref:Uncharacterized protein n=1 Tax=Triparma laevis f. inornata TaxID=1714386 RepID=A0A9W6ZGU3_9STRA|nr:hypothetical protein TL16_g01213 [Triparma laevis f. inornata]